MTVAEMFSTDAEAVESPSVEKQGITIVVATDGSEAADAALAAAELIGKKTDCRIYLLSVLESIPAFVPLPEALIVPADFEIQRAASMRAAIGLRAMRFDPDSSWTTELRIGQPAVEIAKFVREHDASLVIVAANKHSLLGRILGEETAMSIAQMVDVPLLVASQDMRRLPERVLIAMDIKPFGMETLPSVLPFISDTSTVSCLHVKPRADFMGIDWAEFDSEYEVAMRERFADVEKMLGKVGIRPELVIKHGDVTRELSRLTENSRADLVVVGIMRRRGKGRAVSGRLAGRTMRHLDTSVLIVPGMEGSPMQAVAKTGGVTEVLQNAAEWSGALKAFTSRNAGRICTLEIDDPEIGALVEARSYPLRGVDYDHRDGRLTITVGDSTGTERHLTRSVPAPDSISILSVGGKDTAMSVAHGPGQTLLMF